VALGFAGQTATSVQLAALMIVNASVAVGRFEVMRHWVFGS
jgi:hypothetical protein